MNYSLATHPPGSPGHALLLLLLLLLQRRQRRLGVHGGGGRRLQFGRSAARPAGSLVRSGPARCPPAVPAVHPQCIKPTDDFQQPADCSTQLLNHGLPSCSFQVMAGTSAVAKGAREPCQHARAPKVLVGGRAACQSVHLTCRACSADGTLRVSAARCAPAGAPG